MVPLHLSTVLTRTPSTLLSHITHISREYAGKGHTVLFTLSNNFRHPQDLEVVVDKLTKFNDINDIEQERKAKGKYKGHTIGCLTDSFSSATFEGLPVTVNAKNLNDGLLSFSIGIFDSNLCIPFRSTLPGRAQPQVGRWHSFRKKDSHDGGVDLGQTAGEDWEPDWQHMNLKKTVGEGKDAVNWEDIWSRSSYSSSSSTMQLLPETLHRVAPQIQTLLTLSSPHPDTLAHVLSNALSNAPSLTLIAAPTHFTTGRGVTLFLDGQIFGDGAVGIALLNDTKAGNETQEDSPICSTEFLGVSRLSGPMTVTSREGNMINALNSSNPTKLLLSALDLPRISPSFHVLSTSRSSNTFKDDEQFALGVLAPDGQISRTYKITAGDPSSRGGSLSLDAPTAPDVGSVVQFLRVLSNSPIEIPASFLPALRSNDANVISHKQQVLASVTIPELFSPEPTACTPTAPSWSSSQILKDTFLVPSTQGFVLSRGSSSSYSPKAEDAERPLETKPSLPQENTPWTCSLPGGAVSLQWK